MRVEQFKTLLENYHPEMLEGVEDTDIMETALRKIAANCELPDSEFPSSKSLVYPFLDRLYRQIVLYKNNKGL